MQVTWAAEGTTSPADFVVHVSTDQGANWCQVVNGDPITDFLHATTTQRLCLFPTVCSKLYDGYSFPIPMES